VLGRHCLPDQPAGLSDLAVVAVQHGPDGPHVAPEADVLGESSRHLLD
jgi:hypothetical protein